VAVGIQIMEVISKLLFLILFSKLQTKRIYEDPNNGQNHYSRDSKRARTSLNRKSHQNSSKIKVNKHLSLNDPGLGERGQGYMIRDNHVDSDSSFDVEVKSITKNNRSSKAIEYINRSKKNIHLNNVNLSNSIMQKINPINIKRSAQDRSSSSNLKKKKRKGTNLSITKINPTYKNQNFNIFTKHSSTTKADSDIRESKMQNL
jgi:hypothetical protein